MQHRQRTRPAGVRRIGFLCWLGNEQAQEIYYGINEMQERLGRWDLVLLDERGLIQREGHADTAHDMRLSGVISTSTSWSLVRMILEAVPVVNVAIADPIPPPIPTVSVDQNAAGHLAAEYLLDLHLRRFMVSAAESDGAMAAAFRARIKQAGYAVESVTAPRLIRRLRQGSEGLSAIPALFCPSDRTARTMIRQVTAAGLSVPGDVVILGFGNNRMLCGAPPTLSSIALPLARIGVEAVHALESLINGRTAESRYLEPVGVVSRASTDVIPFDDPAVCDAIAYMRDNMSADLRMRDIARHAGVHVRVLQRRFRATLGHPVSEYLFRLRMTRAQELLKSTSQPVKAIAIDVGYRHLQSFFRAFRARAGMTPTQFRELPSSGGDGARQASV